MKKAKFVEREITEEKKETSYVTPITSNDFVVQEEKSSVFPSNHGLLDTFLQVSSNPWSNSDEPIEYFILFFTDEVWNFIYKETQRYSTETFSMSELMSTIGLKQEEETIGRLQQSREIWHQ